MGEGWIHIWQVVVLGIFILILAIAGDLDSFYTIWKVILCAITTLPLALLIYSIKKKDIDLISVSCILLIVMIVWCISNLLFALAALVVFIFLFPVIIYIEELFNNNQQTDEAATYYPASKIDNKKNNEDCTPKFYPVSKIDKNKVILGDETVTKKDSRLVLVVIGVTVLIFVGTIIYVIVTQ